MKKLFISAVFVLVANLAIGQTQAFKDDVKKLVTVSGALAEADIAKKQILTMVAADKQEAFIKDFNASLTPIFAAQESFFLAEFTHEEVKQLIKFYETPVGKKLAEKKGKQTESIMPAFQQWSMGLQEMIMKYQK